jgi:hypothetical protein
VRTLERAVAFVSVLALCAACGDGPAREVGTTALAITGPTVWTVGSLERIGKTDSAGATTHAEISAGGGEYESFQIVIQGPPGGLSNVNVKISDLKGPGSATIGASNISLYREWYVQVTSSSPNWGGSNQPLGPGDYADGLIPFIDPSTGKSPGGAGATLVAAPFSVAAGNNQPVWVDVYVPPGTSRGAYSGSYVVSTDQGNFTGTVALTVWGFTLPARPALKSSFLVWNTVTEATYEELLRNKLDPLSEPASEQSVMMSSFGLESVGLPFFSGADVSNCTMSPAPSVSAIAASASAQAPGLYLYAYTADEIGSCTGLYPTIQAWGKALHTAGVDNLVTMAPVPALFDDGSGTGRSAVDDWTVLPLSYDANKPAIAMALAKGDHMWSYNTLVQDAYSPKWEIDFAPLNFRIQPGFLSATLSLTGLLYWRVDQWSPDPWVDVNNAGTYSSSNYPGEAQLLYPGTDVGIGGAAPSMRLKWLRDGVEDYDYYALLDKAGKGAWALAQIATVAPDWSGWTRDPSSLSATRQALGEALDALGASGGDGGGTPGADGGKPAPDAAPVTMRDAEPAPPGDVAAPRSGCACQAGGNRRTDLSALLATILFLAGVGARRRDRRRATFKTQCCGRSVAPYVATLRMHAKILWPSHQSVDVP